MSSLTPARATTIPVRSVTHRSARSSSLTARDVVLTATFLLAFPLAVNVTAVLAEDGIPDRRVPLLDRRAP